MEKSRSIKKQKNYLDDLTEIRSIMERSSRFLSLSGYSGIFAGIFAIIGGAVAHWYLYNSEFLTGGDVSYISGQLADKVRWFFIVDGAIVLLFALISAVFFSWIKARKLGMLLWDQTTKRVLINLSIPLIAGGVFIFVLMQYNLLYFLIPVSLLFYGLALLNAGNYTLSEVRYLGIAQIVTGIFALVFLKFGLYFWIFGFGILHIVYGLVMHFKYDKKKA